MGFTVDSSYRYGNLRGFTIADGYSYIAISSTGLYRLQIADAGTLTDSDNWPAGIVALTNMEALPAIPGVDTPIEALFNAHDDAQDQTYLYAVDDANVIHRLYLSGVKPVAVDQALAPTYGGTRSAAFAKSVNSAALQAISPVYSGGMGAAFVQHLSLGIGQAFAPTYGGTRSADFFHTIPTPYTPFDPQTPIDGAPDSVSNLRISADTPLNNRRRIKAEWTAPEGTPPTHYEVIVAERDGDSAPYVIAGQYTTTETSLSFYAPTGALGGYILVAVHAVNSAGASQPLTAEYIYGDEVYEDTYPIYVDWDRDGFYANTASNISRYVEGWSVEHGSSGKSIRSLQPARASFRLNSEIPVNDGVAGESPYYGARIQLRHKVRGGTAILWTGRITAIKRNEKDLAQPPTIMAVGEGGYLKQGVSTELLFNTSAYEAWDETCSIVDTNPRIIYGADVPFHSWQARGSLTGAMDSIALNTQRAAGYPVTGALETPHGQLALYSGWLTDAHPFPARAERVELVDPVDTVTNRIVINGISGERPQQGRASRLARSSTRRRQLSTRSRRASSPTAPRSTAHRASSGGTTRANTWRYRPRSAGRTRIWRASDQARCWYSRRAGSPSPPHRASGRSPIPIPTAASAGCSTGDGWTRSLRSKAPTTCSWSNTTTSRWWWTTAPSTAGSTTR